MTTINKLQLRQSELRQKLNDLIAKDSLTDEERSELESATREMADLEPKLRGAIVAQEEENRKANEDLDPLRTRATLGGYWSSIIQGRSLTGAEDELNKELGLASNQVPWDMFDTPVQERAATTTTQNDGGLMQRPILSRLFARDVFDALGVRLESVPAGQTEFVVLTSGQTPSMKAEGAAADAAVASNFTVQTLSPKRLTSRIEFSREVMASVAGIENALRSDLLMSMRDTMNSQILTGDGTSPNVAGIFSRLTKPSATGLQAADYADFAKMPSLAVDGLHANSSNEVGVVMSPELYRRGSAVFQDGSGESGIMGLNRVARSVQVSAHVPAATTTGGTSNRQDVSDAILCASGVPGSHVAAVWQGVSLISDELSLADKGEVRITAYALWDAYTCFRPSATKLVALKLK